MEGNSGADKYMFCTIKTSKEENLPKCIFPWHFSFSSFLSPPYSFILFHFIFFCLLLSFCSFAFLKNKFPNFV